MISTHNKDSRSILCPSSCGNGPRQFIEQARIDRIDRFHEGCDGRAGGRAQYLGHRLPGTSALHLLARDSRAVEKRLALAFTQHQTFAAKPIDHFGGRRVHQPLGLVELLDRALLQLSPKAQATFLLYRRDGKSMDEISQHLGISRPMAKKYLVKALVHFRKQLKDAE